MHSRISTVLLVSALVLLVACGSRLTEAEVLAHSATTISIGQQAGDGAAAQPTSGSFQTSAGPSGPGVGAATGASAVSGGGVNPGAAGAAGAPSLGATAASGTRGNCKTADTGPIVIGSVGDYSGAAGSSEGPFATAVQAWAATVNRGGGLCGRQVKVIVQDDGGDPAQYGSLVRQLVEQDHVLAFVANGAVLAYQGGVDYLKKVGVPVFGNDCSTGWYGVANFAPTCTQYPVQVRGMVQSGVLVAGLHKFGYVSCQEAAACHEGDAILQGGAVKAAGATLVYRSQVSITQVDFTSECQAARQAGGELFTVGADAATTARFAQACARQNWFPQYVGISFTLGPDTISNPGLEKVVLEQPTFPFTGASGGAIDQYNQVAQAYGAPKSPALSNGWTGAKLFELVATRAANANATISPRTLVAALATVHNETLGGLTVPLTFGASGAQPANCWFVMQGDGTGKGFKLPFGSKPYCI